LEGRSTVAVGLATAWAENGQKIVLVDAHLRRPKLHEWFGLSNDIGLSTLLERKSRKSPGKRKKEMLARTERANLTVLVSGPSDSEDSSPLTSPQLQDVLDDLATRAEVVIVDGPPVLSTPDAAILASKVDGILLVFNADKTRLKAALEAVRILTRAGGNILGATLFSSN
jgi:non-specific protein-tyrosine kinase